MLNPFSPVAVDTEFKPGDDMILVERRFKSGRGLQAIGVARRGSGGGVRAASGSYGVKWHMPVSESDLEVFAMRHYQDSLMGFGLSHPVKELLVRTDLIMTRTQAGAHRLSRGGQLGRHLHVERNTGQSAG